MHIQCAHSEILMHIFCIDDRSFQTLNEIVTRTDAHCIGGVTQCNELDISLYNFKFNFTFLQTHLPQPPCSRQCQTV